MGRIANVMRECMDDFNRKVRDAMYGDETAREWLISGERWDSVHIDCTKPQFTPKTHRDWPKRCSYHRQDSCEKCPYKKQCKNGKVDLPKKWKDFREWVIWNNSHGGSIRRMVQQANEADRRNSRRNKKG